MGRTGLSLIVMLPAWFALVLQMNVISPEIYVP